jgi:hypothetical protein
MQILDAKAVNVQKMLSTHCCKNYQKNACNGFGVKFFFFFFARIKCNSLVEILDARVIKAQDTCLLC